MSPHPSLNAFTPGTWARVVSGVVWADYAVNEGQVTAKTARGPLALLSLSGEGEDLPRLHAPTPDALEVEVDRLNLRPHFLAFVRCAQGRGRVMLGESAGETAGMLSLWRGWSRRTRRILRLQALEWVRYIGLLQRRREAGQRGIVGRPASRVPSEARRARQEWRKEQYRERIRNLAPAHPTSLDPSGVDWEYLGDIAQQCYVASHREESPEDFTFWKAGGRSDMIAFAILSGDKRALRGLIQAIKRQALRAKLTSVEQVKALEAAAYRAHVTRRVRPPARRPRVRRPLHARPRPPTCPAAPPALPAPVC